MSATAFITSSPHLAKLWHPTKNLPLLPEKVTVGSGKKAWWLDECGHEWEAVIGNLNKKTTNFCPICNGQIVLEGFNDLASIYPELAEQWHPTKNRKTAVEVTAGSGFKAIWKCAENHEWEAAVYHRTRPDKPGCPYCAGRFAVPDVNDLKTLNPELAEQWHSTRNGNVTPADVKPMSNKKVWWLGACGHEWETTVANRTSGKNCPYCSGNKASKEESVSADSRLLKKWSKSNSVNPDEVYLNSKKEYFWICDKGHEFKSSPKIQKVSNYCPVCSNRYLISGVNDVETKHPALKKQWSPKNNVLMNQVLVSSEQKYLWICEKGHETERKIRDVVKSSCPVCLNRTIIPGVNDLATTHGEIASEWHPTKNTELLVTQLGAGSGRKVWWVCKKGHEWETSVISRTSYNLKCAVCSGRKIVSGINDLKTLYPELLKKWSPHNVIDPASVGPGSEQLTWWICDKGHEALIQTKARVNNPDACQKCWDSMLSSYAENSLVNLIKEEGLEVVSNDRKILDGKELDIYIPEKNIAIEFNGVYWHSEAAGKNKNYHYNKWNECKKKGIQLIQIWEDDWKRHPDLIKQMILHKLGLIVSPKMYARKTKIVSLSHEETSLFLTENHIQGNAVGSINLGLADEKNNIVAVMVLKKEPGMEGNLNLLRFATSVSVVGGFTKLLNHVFKTYLPTQVVTFSDNCVSDGGLYKNNGFVQEAELSPNYMYLVKGERKHKFGYRLKKFKNDPTLKYEEGLTERELASLNNIPRIWDAGKTKWVKNLR